MHPLFWATFYLSTLCKISAEIGILVHTLPFPLARFLTPYILRVSALSVVSK